MSKQEGIRSTVYIAGPMRGYEKWNFPAFDEARDRAVAAGWAVISPADLDRAVGFDGTSNNLDGFDMDAAIDRDLDAIRGLDDERGDAVAMLPGWEKSKGASAEKALAEWRGIRVLDARTFEPLQEPTSGVSVKVKLPKGLSFEWLEKSEGFSRSDLLVLHQELTSTARALMEKKNQDYGANSDPFRNFHQFGLLGILVRLSDKLARLQTFTERGELSVKDETVTDTVLDLINYGVLFEGYLRCHGLGRDKAA